MIVDPLNRNHFAFGDRDPAFDRGAMLAELNRIALLGPAATRKFTLDPERNRDELADAAAHALHQVAGREQNVE